MGGRSDRNTQTEDNQEWDAKALAKRVALVKAFDAYGFKKIFTFHSRVEGAKAFTDVKAPYGIKQSFEMLDSNLHRESNIELFHVNGTMSSGERNAYMKEFKEAEIGIMSNARCLTEGVDIPLVDAIAFIDPKRSTIDIVQATGRAMRKAEWKEKGYIFVPVVVDEDTDPEIFLESSDFKTVWQVLQAIVDSDEHIQDVVSRLRTLQGMGEDGSKEWKAAMAEYCEKFEFFNLPKKIDQNRFIKTLYTKAIEVISKSWDFWYGLTLKYKIEYGDANAPHKYKTPEGYALGSWQSHQKENHREGKLDKEKVSRLEGIGFVWELFEEAFEKGYQETLKYKKQSGDANAPNRHKTPEGYALGNWQGTQRGNYKKGKLDKEKIHRLEEIGFIWNPKDIELVQAFEKGYQETLKYKKQYGNANAPKDCKTPEGYALGHWQGTQKANYKKGKLDKEKIHRLEEMGFVWNPKDIKLVQAFEKGYQETLRYKKQHSDANVLNKYKTPEGYPLGSWQAEQRQKHKKGKLDKEKVSRLEKNGFLWNLR